MTSDGGAESLEDNPPPDQPGTTERTPCDALPRSLKVTIQQRNQSREFGASERHATGPRCHVCELTCGSMRDFQDHMAGAEHVTKLQKVTQSLNTHLQERRRWCETCQSHFNGDIIIHRRTKQHKVCKQTCRPFCSVCKRHFRSPRKFVGHMKSAEHKQTVLQEVQEEELITVDAVGCFREEEEEEEVKEEELDEVEVCEEQMEEESDKELSDIPDGESFVVPVRGFVCKLCKRFFYRETTARRTHCETHTHQLNLQSHRAVRKRRRMEDDHKPVVS
ncbi:cdkn1a interacting zinc finger protein 1b isoform X2 [Gouania willdenowi]|nr:cip1-interacting zinc finger protein-like isoform X2 [Gouania willdenowi]